MVGVRWGEVLVRRFRVSNTENITAVQIQRILNLISQFSIFNIFIRKYLRNFRGLINNMKQGIKTKYRLTNILLKNYFNKKNCEFVK